LLYNGLISLNQRGDFIVEIAVICSMSQLGWALFAGFQRRPGWSARSRRVRGINYRCGRHCDAGGWNRRGAERVVKWGVVYLARCDCDWVG